MTPIYQRILLKLSGESLLGEQAFGIDPTALARFALEIGAITALGVQVAIVLGGGNLFRGRSLTPLGLDSITADQIGMLSTVINALAFRDALLAQGLPAKVMAAREIAGMVAGFERESAISALKSGQVLIFAGGTGNPLVTTDSAASLRAIEIKADILLKGTNVDGIYNQDPSIHANAQLYQHITYDIALQKQLAVMDLTAFSQCRDHKLPIRVFNVFKSGLLKRLVLGENLGTLVSIGE